MATLFPFPSSRAQVRDVRERIPGVPVASHEEALSTGKAEELQGHATIPRVPQISQSAGVQNSTDGRRCRGKSFLFINVRLD